MSTRCPATARGDNDEEQDDLIAATALALLAGWSATTPQFASVDECTRVWKLFGSGDRAVAIRCSAVPLTHLGVAVSGVRRWLASEPKYIARKVDYDPFSKGEQ